VRTFRKRRAGLSATAGLSCKLNHVLLVVIIALVLIIKYRYSTSGVVDSAGVGQMTSPIGLGWRSTKRLQQRKIVILCAANPSYGRRHRTTTTTQQGGPFWPGGGCVRTHRTPWLRACCSYKSTENSRIRNIRLTVKVTTSWNISYFNQSSTLWKASINYKHAVH